MSNELLQRYVACRSEQAFADLVAQHIDLVYSAALRQVNGDAATAQDVTQAVFTDLAHKAPRLTRHTSLTGWLYTSTRFLASKARRADQRRRAREQEAHTMNQLLHPTDPDPSWDDLRPVIDDVMHELSGSDREAVLMRYFERRPLAEIGIRLGLTENAARMRVERALDKLRDALARRGVTSTLSVLALVLCERAVSAAPAGLTLQVAHTATATAAAGAGGLLLGWLKLGTLKWMAAAGSVALVAGWLAWPHPPSRNGSRPEIAAAASSQAVDGPVTAAPASDSKPATARPEQLATSNKLVLQIISADNGKPVPNVSLDYWVWLAGDVNHRKPLATTRFGRCDVPVPRDKINRLILVSQVDGFADTRLEWNVDRGAVIPEEYTLKLARAVHIGGQVVDPDGQPVAGAEVGFNNESNPAGETFPESRNFGWPFWIVGTTDAEGHWQINRLSKEIIRTLYGSASHSNYTGSGMTFNNRTPEAEKQLLAGTFVFHLGRAVSVDGFVVDQDNQPIAGAHILVGGASEGGHRETKSRADGSFHVDGCKPGNNSLTAEAKGFAASTLKVNLEADSAPFRLTLKPGNVLRIRLVDQQGAPVKNAYVWLNTFQRGTPEDDGSPPVQADFSPRTDADGRVVWESAPNQQLTFDFQAAGFMRVNVKLRPDGQEHVVTLPPGVTISGTVRDAGTGKPIPRFRIVTGWPEFNPITGATNQHWSTIDRFWLNFEGGQFRHVYEEPVLNTTPNPGFLFKFQAEGYAAVVTRHVGIDEREARFDIQMRPANDTTVTVVLPDGRPAANADIGLVSPGAQLRLVPGGFDRANGPSGSSLLMADDAGHFTLPADTSLVRIIAAHPDGYAEATLAALTNDPTLRLEPWGRLEGTFRSGGVAASGRALIIQYGSGDYQTISCDFTRYQVKTDGEGHFAFPQAPPGKHKVIELVPGKGSPGGTVWTHHPLIGVEVRPGETTKVTIGDSGYKVTARLRWPAGQTRSSNSHVYGMILSQTTSETGVTSPALIQTSQGTATPPKFYEFNEEPNGSMTADSLPAGSYLVKVAVIEQGSGSGQTTPSAQAEIPLTVPAEPATGTLDLGEIALKPAP
jgi:RNA polymerase sigma factor (sigma-70 family)